MQEIRKRQVKQWLAILVAISIVLYSGLNAWRSSQVIEEASQDWLPAIPGLTSSQSNQELQLEVLDGTNAEEKIVILPMHGVISGAPSGGDPLAYDHDTLLDTIQLIEEDPTVVGVLFDVDSGGGAVYHGAQMYRRLKELKETTDLPIYTTMGSIGASAAYYIPMASDRIYAAPETVTGSIGVIQQIPNVSELVDKLGVEMTTITTGKYKDLGNPFREMTDEERQMLQKEADDFLDVFVQAVMDGRNLSEEAVRKVATGETFNGEEALELDLIDAIGYYDDALADLVEATGATDPQIVRYHLPDNFDPFGFMNSFPFAKSETADHSPEAWIEAVIDFMSQQQFARPELYSSIGEGSHD